MPNNDQHIITILDRSGSMASRAEDTIGSYNTMLEELQSQAEADGVATIMTLVTFADHHSIVFGPTPVAEVRRLDRRSYRPSGSTALLDAVYENVTRYRDSIGQGTFGTVSLEDAPAVLVVVITDGEENASRRATWEQVQQLITACEALGNWTFTYIGAHRGAWAQARGMRVKFGNVLDASGMTTPEMMTHLRDGLRKNRAGIIRTGSKSTENFFSDPAPTSEDTGVR
jgi:Mg-chelatase subunit ChlD